MMKFLKGFGSEHQGRPLYNILISSEVGHDVRMFLTDKQKVGGLAGHKPHGARASAGGYVAGDAENLQKP